MRVAVVGERVIGKIAICANPWVVCGEAGHWMDSARTLGATLQMDMHEMGHEQSGECLVSDRGLRRGRVYV